MMQISTPNAAYKIGSLVRKGYVEKIQSTTDRREYHLRPTQEVYRLLQHQLFLPAHRHRAGCASASPPRT